LRAGLAKADEGLLLLRQHPQLAAEQMGFFMLGFRALALTQAGRLEEAEQQAEQVLHLARRSGNPEMESFAYGWCCQVAIVRGDSATALAHGRRSLEAATRVESAFSRVIGFMNLSSAQLLDDQFGEAVSGCERALEVVREQGVGAQIETFVLISLAQAYMGEGRNDQARATAEAAVALARKREQVHVIVQAQLALAQVLLQTEGAAAAEVVAKTLAAAEAQSNASGFVGIRPQIRLRRAGLARSLGDQQTYRRELRAACDGFTAIGATGHARRVAREIELASGS
jgi:ATP/maltotriose-dependent transcriptional regulator MalT